MEDIEFHNPNTLRFDSGQIKLEDWRLAFKLTLIGVWLYTETSLSARAHRAPSRRVHLLS